MSKIANSCLRLLTYVRTYVCLQTDADIRLRDRLYANMHLLVPTYRYNV